MAHLRGLEAEFVFAEFSGAKFKGQSLDRVKLQVQDPVFEFSEQENLGRIDDQKVLEFSRLVARSIADCKLKFFTRMRATTVIGNVVLWTRTD